MTILMCFCWAEVIYEKPSHALGIALRIAEEGFLTRMQAPMPTERLTEESRHVVQCTEYGCLEILLPINDDLFGKQAGIDPDSGSLE